MIDLSLPHAKALLVNKEIGEKRNGLAVNQGESLINLRKSLINA